MGFFSPYASWTSLSIVFPEFISVPIIFLRKTGLCSRCRRTKSLFSSTCCFLGEIVVCGVPVLPRLCGQCMLYSCSSAEALTWQPVGAGQVCHRAAAPGYNHCSRFPCHPAAPRLGMASHTYRHSHGCVQELHPSHVDTFFVWVMYLIAEDSLFARIGPLWDVL